MKENYDAHVKSRSLDVNLGDASRLHDPGVHHSYEQIPISQECQLLTISQQMFTMSQKCVRNVTFEKCASDR